MRRIIFTAICFAAAMGQAFAAELTQREVALIDKTEMATIDEKVLAIKEADRVDIPKFANTFYYPPREVKTDDNATAKPPAPKEPLLQAIFDSKALMNGEWKRAGDKVIGGWTLQSIMGDMVILTSGNSRRTLSIKGGGVSKTKFISKVGG
ncbi:MAG: hypothetical protein LBU73_10225 [Helicobacteraceae bacterium]|jgi:hypothetical protein|nr:hypothetical protein [Helicobacteraceae bacterium]